MNSPRQDPPLSGPRWILHPALIAAGWVLEVALANKIEPAGFGRSLVMAVLIAVSLTLIGWAVTHDRWLGGLVATTLIAASISLLPIFFAWEALHDAFRPGVTLAAFALLLATLVAIPAVQVIRVRRGHQLLRRPATSVLNRLGTVFVVVVLIFYAGPDLPRTIANALRAPQAVSVAPTGELPDIYVVLVDGYPRADVLSRLFGIDNAPFVEELESLGFDVALRSQSNYVLTQLTLASMFQMRHLDAVPSLEPLIGIPGGHVNELRDAMVQGPAFVALHSAGYQVVVSLPGYEAVALRGVADRVLEHGEMNDLERDVLKRTWLLDPLALALPGIYTYPQRDRIVNAFDDLERLSTEARSAPIFAWIHIPAPHLPLVLGADGDPIALEPRRFDPATVEGFGYTDAEFRALYAAEVSYLNERLLAAIRELQSSNARPDPVIIVMADHGYSSDPA
ncbi:MAG: hypothetical protein M3P32_03210, partial [Chloroflexota bacterium]|nr:hypothetical protein [Chloroflexota bacterium]